jgi:hypothetical protein
MSGDLVPWWELTSILIGLVGLALTLILYIFSKDFVPKSMWAIVPILLMFFLISALIFIQEGLDNILLLKHDGSYAYEKPTPLPKVFPLSAYLILGLGTISLVMIAFTTANHLPKMWSMPGGVGKLIVLTLLPLIVLGALLFMLVIQDLMRLGLISF